MAISKYISYTASTLNLFKIPIRLKIRSKDYFSSRAGELISLLIYAYLLNGLITSDVFSKKNPNVLEKEIDNPKTSWFNFTEENFFFASIVVDQLGIGHEFDASIASIKTSYNTFTGGYNIENYITLDMIPCKYTYAAVAFPELMAQYPAGLCLPNPRFTIGGFLDEPRTESLEILLKMCVNTTENNNSCKPQAKIDEFFTNKRFGFVVTDNLFAADDYEHPVKLKTSALYFNIDSRIRKFHTINIQKVSISDDDGLVFSEENLRDSWKIGLTKNDFDFNNNIELFQVNFFSTIKETRIHRRYMKIQDVLSSLGGIVNVLISVGLIILKFFGPFSGIDMYLSNNLFSFRNMKNQTENTNKIECSSMRRSINTLKSDKSPERSPSKSPGVSPRNQKETNQNFIEIQMTDVKTSGNVNQNVGIRIEQIDILDTAKPLQLKGDDEGIMVENQSEVHQIQSEKLIQEKFMRKMTNHDEELSSASKLVNKHRRKSIPKAGSIIRSKTGTKNLQDDKKIVEHFKNYSKLKDKKNNLTFSFNDLMKTNERKNLAKKMKALNKATHKIHEDLDITNIMQKFQEIDKLKLLLMNRKQLMLFDLIAKPEIFIDDEEKTDMDAGLLISHQLKGMKDETDQNLLDLVVYYNHIKNKENNDDFEGRLIKLIDGDMKKYFET